MRLAFVLTTLTLIAVVPVSARAVPVLTAGFVDDTLVTGLNQPNGLAFAPDGRMFLTERSSGLVRMVVNGHLASTDPAVSVAGLNGAGGERGLQGIAVDPRWPAFPYVYVAYTHTGNRSWLVRYTASGGVANPNAENITLGSPLTLIDDVRDSSEVHNGLGLRFDGAGYLYLSVGDDEDRCSAQDPTILRGKLLRLDVTRLPAGGGGPVPRALLIPPDHAIAGPDSNAMLVHAYGLRNPWRFHFDPATQALLLADVGELAYDELDEIAAAGNFGWPYREGPAIKVPGLCSEPGGPGGSTYIAPIFSVANDPTMQDALTTAAVYRPVAGGTRNWPASYHGDLFYVDYFHGNLRRLRKTGGTWAPAPAAPGQPTPDDFATGIYSSVDYLVGPDGSLYWLKQWDDDFLPLTGTLRRIRYTGPPGAVDAAPVERGLEVAPNPFAVRTVIGFRASGARASRVAVYDAAGRRVRAWEAMAWTGAVRLEWDGRDQAGIPVPAGIYLVRVEGSEGRIESHRVLRLR